MIAIRAGVLIGAMALIVAVVFAVENRQTRGATSTCVVDDVLPASKGATLFARCDTGLVKVPVSAAAALFHGTPAVGERLVVRVNDRGAVWDKPAARHALSGMLVPGFVLISAFLWWRRTA